MPEADDVEGGVLEKLYITEVLHKYCRGVDRRDYELIRSCYHPDASDHHGDYVGDVDGFIQHVHNVVSRFDRTMHFLSNILIDVAGDVAHSESYVVAQHHLHAVTTAARPRAVVVGARYIDRFERRATAMGWRIARRRCVYEWWRIDETGRPDKLFSGEHLMGKADRSDLVFDIH